MSEKGRKEVQGRVRGKEAEKVNEKERGGVQEV